MPFFTLKAVSSRLQIKILNNDEPNFEKSKLMQQNAEMPIPDNLFKIKSIHQFDYNI